MQSGPALWLMLLTVGVLALGAAMAYGIDRNRTRTAAERHLPTRRHGASTKLKIGTRAESQHLCEQD